MKYFNYKSTVIRAMYGKWADKMLEISSAAATDLDDAGIVRIESLYTSHAFRVWHVNAYVIFTVLIVFKRRKI